MHPGFAGGSEERERDERLRDGGVTKFEHLGVSQDFCFEKKSPFDLDCSILWQRRQMRQEKQERAKSQKRNDQERNVE